MAKDNGQRFGSWLGERLQLLRPVEERTYGAPGSFQAAYGDICHTTATARERWCAQDRDDNAVLLALGGLHRATDDAIAAVAADMGITPQTAQALSDDLFAAALEDVSKEADR